MVKYKSGTGKHAGCDIFPATAHYDSYIPLNTAKLITAIDVPRGL